MISIIKRKVPLRLFSDREAWNLFRLAAFSEAIGWTLLIAGILIKHFLTPGNNTAVRIAGEVHGTIFIMYLAAVVVTAGSMGWSYGMTLIAGIASVPPYGTLVLELILSHFRHKKSGTALRQVSVRAIIPKLNKILAYQPSDDVAWLLPGGVLGPNQSAKATLQEYVLNQTGIKPRLAGLAYVYEYRKGSVEHLEMFFAVSNADAYQKLNLKSLPSSVSQVDEIAFINPHLSDDISPAFLQTDDFKTHSLKTEKTIFITNA